MVANFHKRGCKIKRLLAYVLNPNKDPEVIAGTASHKGVKALAKELSAPCRTRPDSCERRWVEHISLSVPQDEKMDVEKFAMIVTEFMTLLGFSETHLWVAVIHRDTPTHLHVHIVVNRIAIDGSLYGGQGEAKRGMKICDELEKKFGLIRTDRTGKGKGLKNDELAMMLRTGKLSVKQQIKAVVASTLKNNPQITLKDLDGKLSAYGVVMDLNVSSSGYISGISFTKDELTVKGSQIGYSWAAVSRYLTAVHVMTDEKSKTMKRAGRTR